MSNTLGVPSLTGGSEYSPIEIPTLTGSEGWKPFQNQKTEVSGDGAESQQGTEDEQDEETQSPD